MLDTRYSIKNSRNWIKVFEINNRNSKFKNPKYLNPVHPVRSLDPDSVGIILSKVFFFGIIWYYLIKVVIRIQ